MQKAVRKEKLKVIERPVSLRDMLEKLKAEGDLIESDKPSPIRSSRSRSCRAWRRARRW
jgi:hypothetical protein